MTCKQTKIWDLREVRAYLKNRGGKGYYAPREAYIVKTGHLREKTSEISFLWEKINVPDEEHFHSEHPFYGELMPLGAPYLTNGELSFIEKWILEGAPEEGIVADPGLLADNSVYEPVLLFTNRSVHEADFLI